jgi:hypothetical protein
MTRVVGIEVCKMITDWKKTKTNEQMETVIKCHNFKRMLTAKHDNKRKAQLHSSIKIEILRYKM